MLFRSPSLRTNVSIKNLSVIVWCLRDQGNTNHGAPFLVKWYGVNSESNFKTYIWPKLSQISKKNGTVTCICCSEPIDSSLWANNFWTLTYSPLGPEIQRQNSESYSARSFLFAKNNFFNFQAYALLKYILFGFLPFIDGENRPTRVYFIGSPMLWVWPTSRNLSGAISVEISSN